MIIVDAKRNEVEITPRNWTLAADLFLKWGHKIDGDVIHVVDVNDIVPELSAWGIPWKRNGFNT